MSVADFFRDSGAFFAIYCHFWGVWPEMLPLLDVRHRLEQYSSAEGML